MKYNLLRLTWVVALALAWPALAQTTNTFSRTNLNLAIPDGNPTGLSDTTNVTSSLRVVTGVKVKLNVAGEFNGDLYAYVRHLNAQGTNICVLLNRPGRATNLTSGYADAGLNVTFDQASPNDIHIYRTVTNLPAGSPLTGTWQPDGRTTIPFVVLTTDARTTSLTNFNGMDPSGEWTLFVADVESGATNLLVSWEVEVLGQAAPVITWTNPADIVYGTPLSAAQLNASASVPGSFVYSPTTNTLLNAGSNQTLTVVFRPTDTNNYTTVTNTVAINVLKKALTITANNQTKSYGQTVTFGSGSTAFTATGLAGSETVGSVTLACSGGAPSASVAGSPYPITPSAATGGTFNPNNYTITYSTAGTLTVNKATLTVTALNTNKVYGAAMPALPISYSGFVLGETTNNLTALATITPTATASSPVGVYTNTPAGAAATNYTFVYVPGTLTITPATLTVTALNTNKIYGAAMPALPISYSGFVLGETTNNLTALATITPTATASSPVGVYTNTPAGAAATNYAFVYVPGTLTITPATLTVTAFTTNKVYGAPIPALPITYSGFVLSDTTNNLTQPATNTFSPAVTASSPVGVYAITPAGAAGTNYTFVYVPGTLTIGKASTSGSLTSSTPLAQLGQSVAFTFQATAVAPGAGTPTGSVQFKTNSVAAGAPVALSGGQALVNLILAGGTNQVTAEYAGDSNFFGVTNTLAQAVNRPPVASTVAWNNIVKDRLTNLVAVATDPDGDPVTFVLVNTSTNGNRPVVTNGEWVIYSPGSLATNVVDAFSYVVADSRGGQTTNWVTVNLNLTHWLSIAKAVPPSNNSYIVSFDGIVGLTYFIEAATDLATTNWQLLVITNAGTNGRFHIQINPPATEVQTYYRSGVTNP